LSTEYNKADRTTRREQKRPLEWTGAREVQTIRVLPIGREGWTCRACGDKGVCATRSTRSFVGEGLHEYNKTTVGGAPGDRGACTGGPGGPVCATLPTKAQSRGKLEPLFGSAFFIFSISAALVPCVTNMSAVYIYRNPLFWKLKLGHTDRDTAPGRQASGCQGKRRAVHMLTACCVS